MRLDDTVRTADFPERKTKIVCTIGPATSSEEQIRSLAEAGMNVARLNFSHGDHKSHKAVIEWVRSVAEALNRPIAVLQDLAGPKIRIGTFLDDAVELENGEDFVLTTREVEGTGHIVSISYPLLTKEVHPGDRLLLADGSIELEVKSVGEDEIRCRVIVGGRLSSRKGINSPAGLFGIPILGEKDLQDLEFGIRQGVDYVGVSFVRTGEDVRRVKAEISALGGEAPVVAKIETQVALGNFDEILDEADGIMIARGDLSIETPFSRVPVLQKEFIREANNRAKPVITATQMLWSMVENPSPTRAEVADVANAIMDGSDAVMLSDETTIGRYPIRAVETLDTIARDTEGSGLRVGWEKEGSERSHSRMLSSEEEVARSACQLARRLGVDFIGTFTSSGETARFAAKYRPVQPILAVTPELSTYRLLALVRGVVPLYFAHPAEGDPELPEVLAELRDLEGWRDKKIVLVSRDSVVCRGLGDTADG